MFIARVQKKVYYNKVAELCCRPVATVGERESCCRRVGSLHGGEGKNTDCCAHRQLLDSDLLVVFDCAVKYAPPQLVLGPQVLRYEIMK